MKTPSPLAISKYKLLIQELDKDSLKDLCDMYEKKIKMLGTRYDNDVVTMRHFYLVAKELYEEKTFLEH